MRSRRVIVAVAVLVACLIAIARASSLMVDWVWFSSTGHSGVFWTVFTTKIALFVTVFAVSGLLLWGNATLALRLTWRRRLRLPASLNPGFANVPILPGAPDDLLRLALPRIPWRSLILAVSLAIGALIAIGEAGQWDLALRFIYQAPYGRTDPLFGKDIGFYLFSLPAWIAVKDWMLLSLAASAAMAGAVYFVHGDINPDRWPWRISRAAIGHGSALLAIWFAVKAWSYQLDRFLLLYNDNGIVVGASYTDVHVVLPVLWLLTGVAVIAALIAAANVWRRVFRPAIAASALLFGGSFVLAEVAPALFERFYVKPSELQLESSYIRRNIDLTREAYNLRQIEVKPFPGVDVRDVGEQPRHRQQHPAVGLATFDGHLRATAGNPHVLQIPRCRH